MGLELSPTRAQLLGILADAIASVRLPHPTSVAVDGPDAAGKTTLANELAAELGTLGRTAIRASLDGFHRPRAERYLRGGTSPEGYYEDSFDHAALRACLLDPLGPGGDLVYRTEAFDYRADAPTHASTAVAPRDGVLVLDGVFLLRPELLEIWDFSIYVKASEAVILRRARRRDVDLLGSPAEVEKRYRERYLPAQRLYAERARPMEAADVVVLNNDPFKPILVRSHI